MLMKKDGENNSGGNSGGNSGSSNGNGGNSANSGGNNSNSGNSGNSNGGGNNTNSSTNENSGNANGQDKDKSANGKGIKFLMKQHLELIAQNPYVGRKKKGELYEIWGYGFNFRGTFFRIAYKIYGDELIILVIAAGSHEGFWEEVARFL